MNSFWLSVIGTTLYLIPIKFASNKPFMVTCSFSIDTFFYMNPRRQLLGRMGDKAKNTLVEGKPSRC
ncbi:UNVERIFIED_CONTAM: hypothetical protein ABID98_000124 [Brevibacillus sp. OAP136]